MADTKYLIARTPGGAAVYTCACGRDWMTWFTRMGVQRGLIKSSWDIWQGGYRNGATKKSAGTHDGGGVFDLAQNSTAVIRLEREMGAAGWYRDPSTGLSGENHLVLIGCPHHPQADYQVDAYQAGYDGLGYLGRKHKDPGPRVSPIRTWSQGITWAKQQLKEEDVALSKEDKQFIQAAVRSEIDYAHLEDHARLINNSKNVSAENQKRIDAAKTQAHYDANSTQVKINALDDRMAAMEKSLAAIAEKMGA